MMLKIVCIVEVYTLKKKEKKKGQAIERTSSDPVAQYNFVQQGEVYPN